MHRLVIKNFGPIEDVDIEVNDLMLFIGPQASGKSTIAKVIFFFRTVREEIFKYFLESFDNQKHSFDLVQTLKSRLTVKFHSSFQNYNSLGDQLIQYDYQNGVFITIDLKAERRRGKSIELSDSLLEELYSIEDRTNLLIEEYKNKDNGFLQVSDRLKIEQDKRVILIQIETFLKSLFDDGRDNIFIPAGRSFFTFLSNQISLIDPKSRDFFELNFLGTLNNAKHSVAKGLAAIIDPVNNQDHLLNKAHSLIKSVLKGEFRSDHTGDKIYINDSLFIELQHSSSGQQESLWILMICFLLILEKRKVFLIVEEPEAHLYPEAQQQIAQLLSLIMKAQPGNQVLVTTHSPYILAAFNNMMLATEAAEKNHAAANAVMDEAYWLKFDQVSAYETGNGKLENIMDEEVKWIKVENLDRASEKINDDYESLSNIIYE